MRDHPDRPENAPDWWLPLPADTRHIARFTSSYRLVEILEHGWSLRVRCLACNKHSTICKAEMLGPLRKYLNASMRDLQPRLVCECGAHDAQTYETNGSYRSLGMAHDTFQASARWIRTTLTEAGLDPADYGYDPLE
jgi:hypothetical protein